MHILPYDYYAGGTTDRLGFARTASLVTAARAEAKNCLLFDNGDFLQGSALGDYCALVDRHPTKGRHPMLAAMNHLNYDAGTLGNHEFNYGLDFLMAAIAGATFPIVSANVSLTHSHENHQSLVPRYVILDRTFVDENGAGHLIRIGVVGFTPPQILIWDHHHLDGKLATREIVETALEIVPQMRRDGADLIVALSHSGIGAADAADGQENVSTALAQVAGIDAVITGHSHLVFPSADFAKSADIDPIAGTLCGKPAVMPGLYGSHLGVLDLYLSYKDGTYKVAQHRSEARPIWQRAPAGGGMALVESHSGVVKIVARAHAETLAWTSRPAGHTDLPLHSFFSMISESSALQLVAAAQEQFVAKAIADTPHADLPVLGSIAPFKAGGRGGPENYTDVPAGNVMLRHAVDLYALPNTSAALRLTGAEVAIWLEFAAGIFHQIPVGSVDHALINPAFPSFNFDMIFGLTFQIDLSKPARYDMRGNVINPESRRIVGLAYQGQAVDPQKDFVIATNSYRIAANSAVLPQTDRKVIFQSTRTNLDVVLSYFASTPVRSWIRLSGRRFASLPGTTVTFDTSPRAINHLAELTDMKIEPIGLLKSGFLRFRLHL